jgi:Ribbon-helix-helix protein, copG family
MATKSKRSAKPRAEPKAWRSSVSFAPELHLTLEQLAKSKKVSVAWIVREAVEKYVADQWPLFGDLKQHD